MRPRRGMAAVVSTGVVVAAVLVGGLLTAGTTAATAKHGGMPVKKMQQALHAKGTVVNGVLNVGIDRTDIKGVHIGKTPIKPARDQRQPDLPAARP
jgi:hypothetical protein